MTDYLESVAAGRGGEFMKRQEQGSGWEEGTIQHLLEQGGYAKPEDYPLGNPE